MPLPLNTACDPLSGYVILSVGEGEIGSAGVVVDNEVVNESSKAVDLLSETE